MTDRKHHVVLVKKLSRLARVDLDRVHDGNLMRTERAPQQLQDRRVSDKRVDGASLGEDVVDAPGPIAKKSRCAPGLAVQEWAKRVADFRELRIRKDSTQDDVAFRPKFFQRLAIRHGSLLRRLTRRSVDATRPRLHQLQFYRWNAGAAAGFAVGYRRPVIPRAVRSATAMIVLVGLEPPEVANTLPSAT